jgi:hypothetical protein
MPAPIAIAIRMTKIVTTMNGVLIKEIASSSPLSPLEEELSLLKESKAAVHAVRAVGENSAQTSLCDDHDQIDNIAYK